MAGKTYNKLNNTEILTKAQRDQLLKDAYLRLDKANAAVLDANSAVLQQKPVLADAMSDLSDKTAVVNQMNVTNELQDRADAVAAAQDDLTAAEEQKTAAQNALKDANKLVSDKTIALTGQLNDVGTLIKKSDDLNFIDADQFVNLINSLNNGTMATVSLLDEDLNSSVSQLESRISESAIDPATKQELLDALKAVIDAKQDLNMAAVQKEQADRNLAQANADVTEKQNAVNEAQNAFESAAAGYGLSTNGKTNDQVIDAAKANQSEVTADPNATGSQARPNIDPEDRDNRNTAEAATMTVGGNATITAGSFGANDLPDVLKGTNVSTTISTEIGGKVDISSDGDAKIQSYVPVDLVNIQAKDDVAVTTTGAINNVSGGNGTMITGSSVELNAIPAADPDSNSNVGSASKPINVNTEHLSGTANEIYVNNANKGTTTLGNVTAADKAVLNFGGSVAQDPDAVLAAPDTTITANGTIGKRPQNTDPNQYYVYDPTGKIETPIGTTQPEGTIAVNTEHLTASSGQNNIYSIGPDLNLGNVNGSTYILANGQVTDGYVYGPLIVDALGNVGTTRKPIHTTDPESASTVYGFIAIELIPGEDEAEDTIRVLVTLRGGIAGHLSDAVRLVMDDLRLDTACEVCALLRRASMMEGCITSSFVGVELPTGPCTSGPLTVALEIPDDGNDYEEGMMVFVLYERNHQLEIRRAYVYKGMVVFYVDGLPVEGTNFVVITNELLTQLGLDAASVRKDLINYHYADVIRLLMDRLKSTV